MVKSIINFHQNKLALPKKLKNLSINFPELFLFQQEKLKQLWEFLENNLLYSNCFMVGVQKLSFGNELERYLSKNLKSNQIIYEPHANFFSLFGDSNRGGSFQKSQNGILILPILRFLENKDLFFVLKSFLIKGQIDFSYFPESQAFLNIDRSKTQSFSIRLIFIGSYCDFEELLEMDRTFQELIPYKIFFEEEFLIHKKKELHFFYSLIKSWEKNDYPIISKAGVQSLLDIALKLQEKGFCLSSDFTHLKTIFDEAVCQYSKKKQIGKNEIQRTFISLVDKFSIGKKIYYEELKNGLFSLHLDQEKVGRVNIISLMEGQGFFDRCSFINQVSARLFVGNGSFINIEKEIDLSDSIYDKGIFILQSYLKGLFENIEQFGFDISITCEQNCSQIGGDSASVAELMAILSAISKIPIPGNICITGALSQYGEALAVGGINQKIEGWCEISDFLYPNKIFVIFIPESNVRYICLNQFTINKIKKNKFKILSYQSVNDLIEFIFKIPTGQQKDGSFSDNSFFQTIEHKMKIKDKKEFE